MKKTNVRHKTVMVAGATGAQGGATANALPERGHKVVAMARNPGSDVINGAKIGHCDGRNSPALAG